jgi:hypothetical protein
MHCMKETSCKQLQLLTLAPRTRIFSTLKMEAIRSSETSVHTRYTRRHIPEGSILHSHRCENLKSYNIGTALAKSCTVLGLWNSGMHVPVALEVRIYVHTSLRYFLL